MRISELQGPLKSIFFTKNDFSDGITNVDIPSALHALLHARENAYNSIYKYNK